MPAVRTVCRRNEEREHVIHLLNIFTRAFNAAKHLQQQTVVDFNNFTESHWIPSHWKFHPNHKSMHMCDSVILIPCAHYHCPVEIIIIIMEKLCKNDGIWNSISDKRRNIWLNISKNEITTPNFSTFIVPFVNNYTRSVGWTLFLSSCCCSIHTLMKQ